MAEPDPTRTANNVPHQNSISRLQRSLLEALAKEPARGVPASVILAHLTESPTASQRASVSKALLRLCQRGLVDRWEPQFLRAGNGYLYALNAVGDGGTYRHPQRFRFSRPTSAMRVVSK